MPDSNSKYTREKREQGEGLTAGIKTAPGVLPGVLRFGLNKQAENGII